LMHSLGIHVNDLSKISRNLRGGRQRPSSELKLLQKSELRKTDDVIGQWKKNTERVVL
jgi:hypothetical protein